jgi:hypothetical protein
MRKTKITIELTEEEVELLHNASDELSKWIDSTLTGVDATPNKSVIIDACNLIDSI